jgi:2-oxoglutarate/2-oxoacid ferredoxin oxidoreductase subunit beta
MATPDNGPDSPVLTKKDFVTDQEVRWCPGCGDYGILSAVQSAFPEMGVPREKFVVVSGIGCASRFPYYMNTYGFHGIHGRAPAIASGLKIMRPDLMVWVVGGDGDLLSIGGNHLIHALRRNVGLKILMFNNRIYGLTKGQYSPTSEYGKKTKSTPYGSVDRPFNTISLALGAEATFVARTVDVFGPHLKEVLRRAAAHPGSAFVEIYQNCNIFNDGAFDYMREKEIRDDATLSLRHGQPLVFGRNRDKGIRVTGSRAEVVSLGQDGVSEADLWVHDETAGMETAFLLSRLAPPDFPTPLGVFRAVDVPSYEQGVERQLEDAVQKKGAGDLTKLLRAGDVWTVT